MHMVSKKIVLNSFCKEQWVRKEKHSFVGGIDGSGKIATMGITCAVFRITAKLMKFHITETQAGKLIDGYFYCKLMGVSIKLIHC